MKKILLTLTAIAWHTLSFSQNIPAYTTDDLLRRVSGSDTAYIVNFWATWCIPCLKELPEFIKLDEHYRSKPVKVLMISLNTRDEYPGKIQEFIAKHEGMPETIWLNDEIIEHYRPAIDERWSGQIPSTILFDNPNGTRHIIEEITTKEAIEQLLNQ